jgi:hypothetical protein
VSFRQQSILLLGLMAAGCARRHPSPAGIAVLRQGGDYLFRFSGCGGGQEPARIMDLNVYRVDGGEPPVCTLVLTHDPHMTIAAQWKYGEVPPAYKKKRCDPLVAGHRYRVEVTHATLDFEVTAGGDVRALGTACR